jgi:putative (di)nucleoside polyphosphate hydrolase
VAATFRAGVIVVVENHDGRVLACERQDIRGAWQLPQGGIDEGEDPVDAAWRELEEETGLTAEHVALRSMSDEWTIYEFPDGHRRLKRHLGQVHRWFRFIVLSDEVEPTVDGVEFANWAWMKPAKLVKNVAKFRKPGYEAMLLHEEAWRDV